MDVFEGTECEVTRLTYRGLNGITTFMVAPDGSLPGSEHDNRAAILHEKYHEWLEKNSDLFDFTRVDIPCKKTSIVPPQYQREVYQVSNNRAGIEKAVESFLNSTFDVDPPLVLREVMDSDLCAELELVPGDYPEIINGIERLFSITLPSEDVQVPSLLPELPFIMPSSEANTEEFVPPFKTVRELVDKISSQNPDLKKLRRRRRRRV